MFNGIIAKSSFTPKNIPGLYSWWDFGDISSMTLNGSTISQINDKSGNGKHLSQGTALNQPTLTTNSAGTRSAATFSGNEWLEASTASDWKFLHYGSDKYGIFAVYKASSTASGGGITVLGTAANIYCCYGIQLGLYVVNSTTIDACFGNYMAIGDGFRGFSCLEPYPVGTNTIIGTYLYGDPFNNNLNDKNDTLSYIEDYGGDYYLPLEVIDTPQDIDPINPLNVGRGGTYGGFIFYEEMVGTINEIIIYKRSSALSETEKSVIFSYLNTKWGLS